jgi:hypothetical protein
MKLAEALILRADSYKRIEQLRTRLKRNAKTQEGDAPAENPGELVSEFEAIARELEKLIQRINRTNSSTDLHKGVTIADALATRDLLRHLPGSTHTFGSAFQERGRCGEDAEAGGRLCEASS